MILKGFSKFIDVSAEILGIIGSLLVLYCMFFGVADVFMRYALNSASQWISVSTQAAMVLIACAGGIYSLKHGAFIKLDIFYAKWSRRKRAFFDILTSIYTFLFLGVLIWKGIQAAQLSIMLNQVTPTAIPIPIYPIKTIIPIAATFVLLMVVKHFINDLKTLFGDKHKQPRPDE
ncbi:TRAP-type mannitol/chloroaromatic compound transport system, small permease component [Modicisalibacter ilicicola DSM 19980]|uniref:TRAP transporter small permease protein n=2 Tax=Modicisalibacter ilicicola TaxID=480814 RepID=A0A1M4SMN3_9GAMM|nr:TRAP-type mannitol/chloroaromatic compound transport system, small permease component [Halomonas ilicicola DSM 19980]